MKIATLLMAIISAVLVACATDVANRYYLSEHYPSRPVNNVQLLKKAPSRSYIVMADFQSRGETPSDMQAKAAEIGADAVIVVLLGGEAEGKAWANSESSTYTHIVGTAIKYTNK